MSELWWVGSQFAGNIKTTVDFYLHTSLQTMQNIFAGADARIQGAFTPPTPPAAQLTHQARA